eukprot:CAMPEP_0201491024 /NCGR_PEP_ID=MMETSP0151_2-20130828/28363_1 /ASSEMBLY_ACC=CAM_ASM_000257 /TAXON_ID=200890 /ORGANISM="Paramoeba atlantica, Strain 621/1 / CCAP 1560/9" /LENGTH=65 /DNA_ID=CAMNT_0047877219 /DNA_START=275 /DNA_END=472 /DNA_ORIENTATION=-
MNPSSPRGEEESISPTSLFDSISFSKLSRMSSDSLGDISTSSSFLGGSSFVSKSTRLVALSSSLG